MTHTRTRPKRRINNPEIGRVIERIKKGRKRPFFMLPIYCLSWPSRFVSTRISLRGSALRGYLGVLHRRLRQGAALGARADGSGIVDFDLERAVADLELFAERLFDVVSTGIAHVLVLNDEVCR